MKTNKHVKDIVNGLLQKWEKRSTSKIMKTWEEVSGEGVGKTKPVKIYKGTMIVVVENSSVLYKMTMEKKKTIECFNKKYEGKKKLKDIRYRVGVIE